MRPDEDATVGIPLLVAIVAIGSLLVIPLMRALGTAWQ
jgi:hypothetical protein